MAAITSLPVTIIRRTILDASPSVYESHVNIQLGDGTSTYPTGGIAIDNKAAGLPTVIFYAIPIEATFAGGYTYRYNSTTLKLQIFDNVGVEMLNTATPNALLNLLLRGY